jgi:acyl-CoA reductase-like NAD-dependent aldehyde dehydrogenase
MSLAIDSHWIHALAERNGATSSHSCQLYIEGEWLDSADGRTLDVFDPATGRVVATQARGQAEDVDRAVQAARRAFDDSPWSQWSARQRGRLLLDIASGIRENREMLATLEAVDGGKIYANALGEIDEVAFMFEYYAGWATKIDGEIPPIGPGAMSLIVKAPVGVCGLIIPWNFPLILTAQKVAPALAAGCTVVVKPAEQTPLSAVALAGIIADTDLPPGVFNLVTGLGEEAGAPLAEHPSVDKISFTGSTEVGKRIMRVAADNMTRLSLELGGKGPNVVLPDADFDAMIDGTAQGIFFNQGQVCGSTSRLIVHRSLHDATVSALVERAADLKLGHGLDEGTTMGPLISSEQHERVSGYMTTAHDEGASVAGQGALPEAADLSEGYFVKPTILTGVDPTMRVAREEIFGPVLSVIPVDSVEEAVTVANDSDYGLTASLWTSSLSNALTISRRIRSGIVWVNDSLQSPVETMFGGFKQSGFGRELGRAGLDEYLERQQIYVRL